MRRLLGGLMAAQPVAALAEPYADFGHPEQCGAYQQADYDRDSWFAGGEGGAVALADPQPVRGLNALLFDGMVVEEGFAEPAGRVMAVRGPLLGVEGPLADEVVVIVTEKGIRLLQPCR
ncbi:hypothetical protein LHP98_04875 [Rhodobacter sp. Har01]|uniref:hypothetical protein n=1 Tax=Rhodobacter sp. Har01 TaxID=2883999 RepID=UPI001D08BC3E|nr:hypothetical protein [Rhodobacter sp. Har01]MCB6177463.1 hypothetical protein [Rhodobacter sp. Har01]